MESKSNPNYKCNQQKKKNKKTKLRICNWKYVFKWKFGQRQKTFYASVNRSTQMQTRHASFSIESDRPHYITPPPNRPSIAFGLRSRNRVMKARLRRHSYTLHEVPQFERIWSNFNQEISLICITQCCLICFFLFQSSI